MEWSITYECKVLIGKDNIFHKEATERAEKEFEIYLQRKMSLFESDSDRAIKILKGK